MKTVSAILSADEHIRIDKPLARIDDFWAAQAKAIGFLCALQKEHDNAPIISSGDLLDKHIIPPFLEGWCIKNLPKMITVPGNHDLEDHSLELFEKSSLSVLHHAGVVKVIKEGFIDLIHKSISIYSFPWKIEIKEPVCDDANKRRIAVIHSMVYEDTINSNIKNAKRGIDLLRKLKGYDLILTGHNHKSFVVEDNGRLLVNPGSMMRSSADQMDHKPRVYLYYAEDNTIEPVYYPIEPAEKVLTRVHIEIKEEKDNRFQSFISKANDEKEVSLSFKDNAQSYFDTNYTRKSIEDFTWESINNTFKKD